MFKSVFAKYVTVFLTIITVGFALLLLIVTSIVNNYSASVKRNALENAAGATRIALESAVYDAKPKDFQDLLNAVGAEQIRGLLGEFADGDDDIAMMTAEYNRRRRYIYSGLKSIGIDCFYRIRNNVIT
jgi:hypothetical protein